jgi:hypothetical protein
MQSMPEDYTVHNLARRKDEITVTLRVSPEIAQQLLDDTNQGNRFLNMLTVKTYARAMKTGRWSRNGETIKFSRTGKLVDGQHRLAAIVMSNVTVELEFRTGLDDEAGLTCDTGRKRSANDIMGMQGLTKWQAAIAAGAVILLLNWERKMISERNTFANEEIADYWNAYGATLYGSLQVITLFNVRHPLFPLKLATALHYMMQGRAPVEDVGEFFARLYRGHDLTETNPIFVLRQWLTPQLSMHVKRRATVFELANSCIRAWNMTRQGKPCTKTDQLRRHDPDFRLPEIAE